MTQARINDVLNVANEVQETEKQLVAVSSLRWAECEVPGTTDRAPLGPGRARRCWGSRPGDNGAAAAGHRRADTGHFHFIAFHIKLRSRLQAHNTVYLHLVESNYFLKDFIRNEPLPHTFTPTASEEATAGMNIAV